jgi:PAS domain S-box-containing protein
MAPVIARILVFSNDPADCCFIKQLIDKDNSPEIIIESTTHLSDALEILKKMKTDVVLLDIDKDSSHGLDSLEAIMKLYPFIPVIVMALPENESVAINALRAGAQDCLIKGEVNERQFIRSVQYSIERKCSWELAKISSERYRKIFRRMTQGVLYYRANGKLIAANSSALKILGVTKEKLVESIFLPLNQMVLQENGNEFQYEDFPFVAALKTGRNVNNRVMGVYNNMTNDYVWLNVSAIPVTLPGENEITRVFMIFEDLTERKKIEKVFRNSLKEKETLIKEVHHRVKNNFQIISSLLSLQSDLIEDKKDYELFNESNNRIRAMAMIHEGLYQSNTLSEIDFEDYTNSICSHLYNVYKKEHNEITIRIEVENIHLPVDLSVPCGLILNELVSNAFKYAFTDRKKGEVFISFKRNENNNCQLIIEDDGTGLPPKNFENGNTLGLFLVDSLVKQIKGELNISTSNGTRFQISFPV